MLLSWLPECPQDLHHCHWRRRRLLLNVKDEIMIERQIGQLREAGIDEIVIVVGYLKEKFEYLKEKYHVILVENP